MRREHGAPVSSDTLHAPPPTTLFHVKHRQLTEVLEWVGAPESHHLMDSLEELENWLMGEGAYSGGLGPNEADVWTRHILDSLMFARGLGEHPDSILDMGSGVGLPGIPLALLFPSSTVTLVDRSGRRMEMARRAARVIGAANVQTFRSEFDEFSGEFDGVVMRASLQPDSAIAAIRGHISPGGYGVLGIGLSPPPGFAGKLVRFPGSEVLDAGRWLHIMRG